MRWLDIALDGAARRAAPLSRPALNSECLLNDFFRRHHRRHPAGASLADARSDASSGFDPVVTATSSDVSETRNRVSSPLMTTPRPPRPAAARVLLTFLYLAAGVSLARAELLFYQTKANVGTTRYYSDGNLHLAEFDVYEPLRIEAVSGWFSNFSQDVRIGISEPDSDNGNRGFGYLHVTPLLETPPPSPSRPGRWMTLDGRKWDLQPGHFVLSFENAEMPVTFSSFSEFPGVAGFTSFTNIYVREDGSSELGGPQGFGIKMYGQPLSAVPEPAV